MILEAEKAVLRQAMKAGITDAGFANAQASVWEEKDFDHTLVIVRGKGECPCGLGVSGFQMAVEDFQITALGLDRYAEYMRNRIRSEGLEHIEEDKQHGRWKD
jgi:hypothetical protein